MGKLDGGRKEGYYWCGYDVLLLFFQILLDVSSEVLARAFATSYDTNASLFTCACDIYSTPLLNFFLTLQSIPISSLFQILDEFAHREDDGLIISRNNIGIIIIVRLLVQVFINLNW